MQIKIHEHHVTLGEERKEYIEAKLENLAHLADRLNDESTEIKLELEHIDSRQSEDAYTAKLTIFPPHGNSMRAEAHSDNLESAVDSTLDKIKPQIEHYKAKLHHMGDRTKEEE